MSRSGTTGGAPRAIVHKRILDAAEANPEASMADLAQDIAGASTDLVEAVLDEYGDPIEDDQGAGRSDPAPEETNGDLDSNGGPSGEPADLPARDDLSEKQLETLRAIRDRPSATQEEIGEALDLSGAAVSNRLSDIDGFDWDEREQFVSDHFGAPVVADGQGETIGARLSDELEQRLHDLEDRLESLATESDSGELPVELAHKVIHAAMRSDRIDEEEELEVIEALL